MAWGAAEVSSWYKNAAGRVPQAWPYPLPGYRAAAQGAGPAACARGWRFPSIPAPVPDDWDFQPERGRGAPGTSAPDQRRAGRSRPLPGR
jgi:hypothetical protein